MYRTPEALSRKKALDRTRAKAINLKSVHIPRKSQGNESAAWLIGNDVIPRIFIRILKRDFSFLLQVSVMHVTDDGWRTL